MKSVAYVIGRSENGEWNRRLDDDFGGYGAQGEWRNDGKEKAAGAVGCGGSVA